MNKRHLCLILSLFLFSCFASSEESTGSKLNPNEMKTGPSGKKGDGPSDRDFSQSIILERHEIDFDVDLIERITSFDDEASARIANIRFEAMTYEVGGLEVEGFILSPKGEGPFPAIIYNRGGNGDFGAIDDGLLLFWVSRFVSWGYVVVASQYRGNAGGEGAEEFGGADVNDVLRLIDILDEEPHVDSRNIGMYGHSRGGLMTYLSLTKTNRISAAVVRS